MWFLLLLLPKSLPGLLLPESGTWLLPALHPADPNRSSTKSILLSWSIGRNVADEVVRYEVQGRWSVGSNPLQAVGNAIHAIEMRRWQLIYSGKGRLFNWSDASAVVPGTLYQFRVRAVGRFQGPSPWSDVLSHNTVLPAPIERIVFELIGTGRNDAAFAQLTVNGVTLYKREDKRGLVVAVFKRENFSLQNLSVYDTFSDVNESERLANLLLSLTSDFFVFVVSNDAWELSVHSRLARAVEFCGGYHFGQWSADFARPIITDTDLSETASFENFGHPFAFVGVPGVGVGGGWESLQLNTGHYLASGKTPRAIIRGTAYFDYTSKRYELKGVKRWSNDYFLKQSIPISPSGHNPIPTVNSPLGGIMPLSRYIPYNGHLYTHVEALIASNRTLNLPQYSTRNFGFQIVVTQNLPKPVSFVDPRPFELMHTELERVWGGPSKRAHMVDGGLLATQLNSGLNFDQRICQEFISWRWNVSNELCYDTDSCCSAFGSTDNPIIMQQHVGLWPTLCLPGVCETVQVSEFKLFDPIPSPRPSQLYTWLSE